jgi:hypothetical protein
MKFTPCPTVELFSRHITESDAEKLEELEPSDVNSSQQVVVARFDTGWFVEVGDVHGKDWAEETNNSLREFFEREGFSPQFLAIVREAQSQRIAYIRFNVDAAATEGLVTFEW